MFAPQFLENKLKFSPYIKEAVTLGKDCDYVAAIVNIDLEAMENWAERRGVAYTGYQDLSQKDEVYELIHSEVERINRDLAADSALAGARIRRFLILNKELDADDGEITRTRKIRRGVIADRYGALIEALYSDRDRVETDITVTYEDGSTGSIHADLRVMHTDPGSGSGHAGGGRLNRGTPGRATRNEDRRRGGTRPGDARGRTGCTTSNSC